MHHRTHSFARRAVVTTAALVPLGLALAAPAIAAPAPAAEPLAAQATGDVDRIAGGDRYGTAAKVALELTADSDNTTTNFIIASGAEAGGGVDALTAGFLSGSLAQSTGQPAPILLSDGTTLSAETQSAVEGILEHSVANGAEGSHFWFVGGESVLSDALITALEDLPDGLQITRVAGADRYETAAAVAAEGSTLRAPEEGPFAPQVYVANGLNPADALSVAPASYLSGVPVLLTKPTSVPAATRAAVESLDVSDLTVLGGPAAVSFDVEDALRSITPADRIAGVDRFDTNRLINETAQDEGVYSAPVKPLLARGYGFADALAAAPLSAAGTGDGAETDLPASQPLLLTDPGKLSFSTAEYLKANASTIDSVVGVGGYVALPDEAIEEANALVR